MNEYTQKQIDAIAEACKRIKPLVAIRCITFNHEPYIRKALEGFVMQKTDFPFVAIVHDDASTDGTAAIIREYAVLYPDIIFPIFENENQYSKRDGSLHRIMNAACFVIGAKYIAFCEGDDYWINPLKLQRQVDFLESHPEYTLCFHNVNIISDDKRMNNENSFNHLRTGELPIQTLLEKWTIPTCSAIFRSELIDKAPNDPNFRMYDNVWWLTCFRYGKVYCINEKMGVYYRNINGYTSQGAIFIAKNGIQHSKALIKNFPEIDHTEIIKSIINNYVTLTLQYASKFNLRAIKYFYCGTVDYGILYFKRLINAVLNHIKV